MLQRAASVEQPVNAAAHLLVDVRTNAVARPTWCFHLTRFLLVPYIDAGTGHGLNDAIVLKLPIHLADGVAVQAGLHGQLTRAGQTMAGREVASRYGETDLVVELRRRGDITFLLDMKTHA